MTTLSTEVGQFYGAVDVGQSKFKDACVGLPAGVTCTDTDTAFRGAIGYQVHSNVAVEASYADYGATKASDGVDTATAEASGFQLSAVGSWPLADAFSVTGKLGLALTKGESTFTGFAPTDDSNTTAVYGIGVRYDINQSVAVRAQWESLGEISVDSTDPLAKGDLSLLSAGVIFNF